MRSFLMVVAFGVLCACSGNPTPVDAGHDAGKPDAGQPDAGVDAGQPSPVQCDFTTKPCDAGTCTQVGLADGGREKRCVMGECDVVRQDCDAGFKCDYADGGRACLPDGTLDAGDPCAGQVATCRKGSTCAFTNSDGGSACSTFCRVSGDCSTPKLCNVTLVLQGVTELPLVCADPPMTCDPLAQDCPNMSDGCYPAPNMMPPGCYRAGNVAPGLSCTFGNDCGKGYACAGAMGSCRQLCRFPSGMPSCPDAGTCTQLSGTANIGVCP